MIDLYRLSTDLKDAYAALINKAAIAVIVCAEEQLKERIMASPRKTLWSYAIFADTIRNLDVEVPDVSDITDVIFLSDVFDEIERLVSTNTLQTQVTFISKLAPSPILMPSSKPHILAEFQLVA